MPVKVNTILLGLGLIGLVGCATGGVKRGHIVMKTSDRTAHVALASGEVQVGDHVELYHNECTKEGGGLKNGGGIRTCRKIEGGHGVVSQLFDSDYAKVEFPEGTNFTEGDTIEKHAH
jgi:uncharacterized Zn finger protein